MPIFEFTCRACQKRFEEIMTLAVLESGAVACPHCGSKQVERNLSTFAAVTSSSPPLPCGGAGCGGRGGFT